MANNHPELHAQSLETPEELAALYWRELQELVEQGEISPSFARRVKADLFLPGDAPELRPGVWRAYVDEGTGRAALENDGRTPGWIRRWLNADH